MFISKRDITVKLSSLLVFFKRSLIQKRNWLLAKYMNTNEDAHEKLKRIALEAEEYDEYVR